MLPKRSDLALDREPLGRFLPWLVAFMAYIAALSLAGVFLLNGAVRGWRSGLDGRLTVQIAAADQADAGNAQAAIDVLRATPGVATARLVPEQEILDLLSPWLGRSAFARELPLPRLIDVTLRPGAEVDPIVLAAELEAVVPGAIVDDHGEWMARVLRLVRTVEALAAVVVALIALVTAGSVVVAMLAGLAIHRETIEVLHLIGAHDSYIARQFAARAFRIGLTGGLIGLVLAVASLIGLGRLAKDLQDVAFTGYALTFEHWAVLAMLPLLIAALAMVTARITVTRSLARMF